MAAVIDINWRRHAQELRETWQARVLQYKLYLASGYLCADDLLGACVLSIVAHNYDEDDALIVLLRAAFPGFKSIAAPFLCSAAKIAKSGHVMADCVLRGGNIAKNQALFANTNSMESHFRQLADRLITSDEERVEMFAAIRRWVVCDHRLDPTMNPADPDARRLSH